MQALVAYLALRSNAPQPRRHVAFQFWPESTEKQALTNLRHVLHDLRRSLPDPDRVLFADARSLMWRHDGAASLDVAEFRRRLSATEQAEGDATSSEILDALQAAVACYRGDLLPSCYDEWIEPERELLRQEFSRALESLIVLLENRREYDPAISYARRLQRHDPLRETTYRTQMRLHALCDDRAGVIRVFDACREMFAHEFGGEPSEATQKLFERLVKDGDAAEARSATAAGDVSFPLVGRYLEWSRLKDAWRHAASGRSGLVVVTGEAGIGKTRLVQELCTWAGRQGVITAKTRSYEAEGRVAYAPVADWLRVGDLRESLARLEDFWLSEIARLVPELHVAHPELSEPLPMDEEWQRRRFFEALARGVLATEKPTILVLDDVQWTDRLTLEWFRYLLRNAPDAPLLIAGTIRVDEIEQALRTLLDDLHRDERLVEIPLGSLRPEDTTAIARHVTGRPVRSHAAERLHAETAGNPLFVVETARVWLHEDGRSDDDAAGVSEMQPGFGPLPSRVQTVISRRLRRLSSAAQAAAQMAAVVGRAFSVDVVVQADGGSHDDIAAALDELWEKRIICDQGPGIYDFTHDRLREVVYRELGPERRRVLHGKVAGALERVSTSGDTVAVQIASHYERAGLPKQGVLHYLRAAESARRVFAGPEAVRLYRHALALLETLPEDPERVRQELTLQTALGACLVAIDGYPAPAVRRAYERAEVLCTELGRPVDTPILRGMALAHVGGGDLGEAYRLGEALLRRAETVEGGILVVEGHYVVGVTCFWQGRFAASRSHLEEALRCYDPRLRHVHTSLYSQDPQIVCLCRLARTLWYLGFPDQGREAVEESFRRARELNHPHTLAYALSFGAHVYLDMRDVARVEALVRESHELAERYGMSAWRDSATILLGWVRAENGDLEHGIEEMQRGMASYAERGFMLQTPQYLGCLASLYERTGSAAAGLSALADAFDLLEKRGERYYEAELHRLRGELLFASSRGVSDVEAALRRSMEVAERSRALSLHLRAAMSCGEALHRNGRTREARRRLGALYARFSEGRDTPDHRRARALLEAWE